MKHIVVYIWNRFFSCWFIKGVLSTTVNAINWALSFFAISIAHSAAFIDSSDPSIATRILENLPATVFVVDSVKAIFHDTIISIKYYDEYLFLIL